MEEAGVKDYVELAGKFCMKRCQEGNAQGVNIDIDGVPYDLKPENVESFFQQEILPRARG